MIFWVIFFANTIQFSFTSLKGPLIPIPHSSMHLPHRPLLVLVLSILMISFLVIRWWFFCQCHLILLHFLERPHSSLFPIQACIWLISLYWFCSQRHKTTRPHFVYQLEGWAEWLYSQPRYQPSFIATTWQKDRKFVLKNPTSISSAKFIKHHIRYEMTLWSLNQSGVSGYIARTNYMSIVFKARHIWLQPAAKLP